MLEQLSASVASGNPIIVMMAAGLAVICCSGELRARWVAASIRRAAAWRQIARRQCADRWRQLWASRLPGRCGPIERFVLPQGAERESTQQTIAVRRLPIRHRRSATFYGVKLTLAVALLLGWLVASHFLPSISAGRLIFFALAACFAGMLLPSIWLDRKVTTRHKLLRNGFPDALDLLTVCVESGPRARTGAATGRG